MPAGLEAVRRSLAAAERRHSAVEGEVRTWVRVGRAAKEEAAAAEAEAEACDAAAAFLNSFADERLAEVTSQVEELVTVGLRTVLGDPGVSFRVLRAERAGRVETSFAATAAVDGAEVALPVFEARGGGLAAVAGFLLRMVLVCLSGGRRIVLLDETFGQLSAEYEEGMAAFVADLAERMGVQVVMVTHSPAFGEAAAVVHRFDRAGGRTLLAG